MLLRYEVSPDRRVVIIVVEAVMALLVATSVYEPVELAC